MLDRSRRLALLALWALACSSPRALPPAALAGVGFAAENVPPEGFVAIFNGKDLSGWKGLVANPPRRSVLSDSELAKAQEAADASMCEHWSVRDGVLVFDGKGDNLSTAKDYGDFELLVDWKILPGGDSGIYLRGSPQVQIWDNPVGSGGLYNNQKHPSKPLARADRPPGEWNAFRIRMVGERVTVHLNGTLVADDVVMENYWERDRPIYPKGPIELQNHGNALYFRNIFLKELPRAYPREGAKASTLRRGGRVAIAGDSITEQRLYSRFLEDYLVACVPELDLRVVQLGWSGERAPGFLARMENDLYPFEPDVVTTCYGMNDGSYRAYDPAIGKAYAAAMREIVARLKERGATVVVGSPGAVDTFTFRNPNASPRVYNANLAHLRDIARDVAREHGMPFANVHDSMDIAMERAKPVLGEAYDVCGADGFHPRPNGHLVMAYAFLVAMGLSGEVGTIALDWGSGSATASEGHKVLSSAGGEVQVESARYPFCFFGDPKSPEATRSIAPFLPFADDLSRFVLRVKGLPSERAAVAWGGASKSFPRAELERGVNLAAEFLDANPFAEAFQKVDAAVARKQAFETAAIKEIVHRFGLARDLLPGDAEAAAAIEALRRRIVLRQAALAAEVRAAVEPVRHTIRIVPE
ncbi:MAG: family 16 glycoside hydrolase [Planctomycetota bacterium]